VEGADGAVGKRVVVASPRAVPAPDPSAFDSNRISWFFKGLQGGKFSPHSDCADIATAPLPREAMIAVALLTPCLATITARAQRSGMAASRRSKAGLCRAQRTIAVPRFGTIEKGQ
jgi:hypothetical protein